MTHKNTRILANNTIDHVGEEIIVQGWVDARRDHGKLIFIDIRDRTGLLQVVFNPKVAEIAHKVASQFHPEDVISITGKINKRPEKLINPKIASGTVELEATSAEVLAPAQTLPFDMGVAELNLELPTLCSTHLDDIKARYVVILTNIGYSDSITSKTLFGNDYFAFYNRNKHPL